MTVEFAPVEITREFIPVIFRDRIEAKLTKLTKRLAKIGAPAPTVEFGPTSEVEEVDEITGYTFRYTVFDWVTVTGVEARHEGWTGLAVLDWTVSADEAFVARFPGHDDDDAPAISDELRTRGPLCDHCGTKRSRNNTIVFAHDDGRVIAVGTGCVLEYLGIDPRTITLLASVSSAFDDDDEGGYTGRPSISPLSFVALAAELTRIFGFTRSGETNSTKELATAIGIVGKTEKWVETEIKAAGGLDMERGDAKAAEIASWLADDDSYSDFIRSAKVAIGGNDVTSGARHAGILAALPFSHDRHIGLVAERAAKRAAEAEARKFGEFIGSFGDKITVKGSVAFYNTYDGTYGTSVRLTVLTDDGNRVTTYGSGNTLFGWSVGDIVEVTGKIKGHDTHETFGKSTVLERVKVKELDANGDPLPECATARCTRPGIACDTCDKLVCPNGHGRHYRDDFHCDSCLEAVWESERERERLARATLAAARSMLGRGPSPLGYSPTLRGADLDKLVPA